MIDTPGVKQNDAYFAPEAIVARLKAAAESPPLVLRVEGGGLPDYHEIRQDDAVIVHRGDLLAALGLIAGGSAETPVVVG